MLSENVVAKQDATWKVRSVVVTCAQSLQGCVFVPESGQKCVGEFLRIERLHGQVRYGCFNFYGVHSVIDCERPKSSPEL